VEVILCKSLVNDSGGRTLVAESYTAAEGGSVSGGELARAEFGDRSSSYLTAELVKRRKVMHGTISTTSSVTDVASDLTAKDHATGYTAVEFEVGGERFAAFF
jgi:hypothetical protein